ncbi:collagen alpha-1(I) chain-like [Ovis canadensis]|uniref:collagen alpha-1(I) chain-like n=1 Tax=Ovis canadensis TaxID=37174 RepID=UPI003751476A
MPESRSLSELTRQIAPPTKNGHAPPPTESRKSYQSVNPVRVRAGINQVGGSEHDDEEPGVPVGAGGRGASRHGDPREVRQPGGGGGRERRSPGRETRLPRSRPRRGRPTARRALGSARVAARRRHRAGGTRGRGGVVRREEEGGGPPSFLPPPPRPARATTPGTADARPRRPPVHPPQSGAGEAGRRGHGDRPAGGARPGTRPALGRAHRGGGAPSSSTRRRRRRRRRRHGRRIGAAAGAGSEPHQGTRPRGAADGEGTEADGRTERGTDGMRPRGADTTQPVAEGRSRGTTRDDDGLAPPPSRGSRPPPAPPPEPQPARGEHSPAAHRRPPPPRPSRARGSPPRPPRSGLPRALLRPGTPPARQRPGDDTHVRRGEAGSGPDRGRERGRSHARDEGEDEAGGGGEGPASTHGGGRGTGTRAPPRGPDDKGRARGRAPRNTSAGSHRHPHARAVPRRLGRRPAPAIPGALNPEARHPGDDALERGGPDRDRTPPPAAAQGARAGATGPSSPPAGGAGEAEADRASRPDTAPLPPGLTPRGPAARTRPPTCRTPGGAQRDPPPTRRGEARAAVGNERHTAPPRHGGHCALGRGSGWGLRYPKAPSRIAREGVLTEGAPSLPRTVSPSGPRRRSASHQTSAGREGSAVQGSGPPHTSVCAVRARAEPARPAPPQGLIHQGLHDEGNRHASPYRLDPPPKKRATLETPTPPWRGPEGDTGLRETTPPLGLRHLRDDLERSRGTAEGHTRHAHTPAWGAQRGGGGTALPATGRAARRAHAEKAKREQSAVSEDQRRPLTPRGKGQQETEGQGQRPHTQPLPSSPSLMGSGGEDKRGAPRTDREERTRSLGTPVPRLARLRLGPGEHDHTTSIRGAKARAANDPKRRTPDTEPTGRGSSQPPPGAHSGGEGRPG